MTMLQFNNLSRPKSRSRSLPSSLRPRKRNRKRSGTINPLIKEVSQPFCFDIINQLANIPARITLYELLKLSKSTREALREALADAEVFVTQLSTGLLLKSRTA